MSDPLLTFRGVTVAFGGVRALDDVRFSIGRRSIHGLIGPNGSGKTTLLNVCNGLLRATSGTVEHSSEHAPVIARTFQNPAISPDLRAIENVMVGAFRRDPGRVLRSSLRLPSWHREETSLRQRAMALLEVVGFDEDPWSSTDALPFAALKKLELARALIAEPDLLILDEPASGLGGDEVEAMGAALRRARESGTAETILVVEHNMEFVFTLCDVITVLDGGHVLADGLPEEIRSDAAVQAAYFGTAGDEAAGRSSPPSRSGSSPGEVLLRVRDLSAGYGFVRVLDSVSFEVQAGEAIGLLGPNGAGKSTLLNSIFGVPRPSSGTVEWRGRQVRGQAAHRLVRQGMALVEQDLGVLMGQTVADNLRLSRFARRSSGPSVEARIEQVYELFPSLRARSDQRAASLSGGERKMLAIGRAVMQEPRLLVLDEPSIGLAPVVLDHLAEAFDRLRSQGMALLIAEQNVTWLRSLLDHAYILEHGSMDESGRISGEEMHQRLVGHYFE